MITISVLLLASLLPHLTFTDRVNVGIVNGKEAKPHSRPYMVSLQSNKTHICGGFLISDEFVLTAAHCRNRSEFLTIVVGAHNLNTMEGAARIQVKSYHKHLDYSKTPHRNDIMLLRLQKKVKKKKHVKWISIPMTGEDIETDSVCSVAGWGSSVLNGTQSPILMEANVKIMNKAKCKRSWGKDFLPSQMMCVYGKGGTCGGDSGGPLVCGNTAVGVTSFGDYNHCNSPKHPEVYTKISAFLPWIKNIIGNV
ncbi:granzyme G-like [Garra rufa]|uniref:granzyme G-like n=1 Tax=Garra rufa TaxID=137080 RepID=UPI003CCE804C